MPGNAEEVINKLFEDYGNVWPPRGDFTDWPVSWMPYMVMCDEMPWKLANSKEPGVVRQWMIDSLKQVNTTEVMADIACHLKRSDQKLTGLSACLSHLKSGYRWGTLPVLKEERDRTTLDFPEELTLPFHKIMDLHGASTHGNFFTLFYANATYDEHNEPNSVRFPLNVDPDVFSMEEEFFVKTVKMEVRFVPVLKATAEFLSLTEEARASRDGALRTLDRRSELLDTIRDSVTKALKEFIVFTTWPEVKRRYWTTYIESMMAWGIDGENGTSGAETFIATFLDEFLHVPGRSFVFKAKPENYGRMADGVVDVLMAIRMPDPKSWFTTFLAEHAEDDQIWEQRSEILRMLHMWRLSHARVASRIIACSEGLASGLDNDITGEITLADSVKKALDERAQETKEAYFKEYQHSQEHWMRSYAKNTTHFISKLFSNAWDMNKNSLF